MILNWIIEVTLQYLEPFNFMHTNEWYWMELFVIDVDPVWDREKITRNTV